MNATVRRVLTAAVLVALLAAATACSPSPETSQDATPTITPVPTSSVEPTAPEAPEVSTGEIKTPDSGTALRAAVLKAASVGLGMSGTLTVYQLYTQETAAVGDVRSASGSRTFFALTGGPDAWELVWSAPFGSSLAGPEALLSAAPQVSPELAGSIDWTKKAPAPKPKPVPAPTLSSFKAFAMKSAVSMAGTSYEGTFTVTAKIAKDSKGVWWGNAMAEPSGEGLESLGIWGRYSKGKWTGEIADFSSQDADAAFFPADVLSKLRF